MKCEEFEQKILALGRKDNEIDKENC